MKIKKRFFCPAQYSVAVLSVVLVSGCGGGSSGDSSNSGASNLSAVQQNYESVALAANGGFHALSGSLNFTTSPTGVMSFNASSYFYSIDSSISQSAASGPQTLTINHSQVASLALPTNGVPARYLINDAVYVGASPGPAQVSYSGANVLNKFFATDGQTVVESLLGTSYTVVPLSGALSSAPAELVSYSAFGLLTNTVNGRSLYNTQAVWQPGSAYVKVVRQTVGNLLSVGDCVAPKTTGVNMTPCSAASTLEAFFPYTNGTTTYQLADGQISTVAGARAWVSNATSSSSATPAHLVFYQAAGGIYVGNLVNDGTTISSAPLGGGAAQPFEVFLNNAALQSVKSAVNF
jgi:hypothetical protein